MWLISELKNGKIIDKRLTINSEFSEAPYKHYCIKTNNVSRAPEEYYDQTFELLDQCRQKIICEEDFPYELYEEYLEKITTYIPEEYKRFYFELSVQ